MSTKSPSLLMIGSFGFKKGTYGGEDVKNRLLLKSLLNQGCEVNAFDTSGWRDRPLRVVIDLLYTTLTKRSNILLCSHAIGAFRVMPYLIVFKLVFRIKISYTVVGYEINNFIEKKPFWINLLKQLDQIIVETNMHKGYLESKGLSNLFYLSNFRDIRTDVRKKINKARNDQLRLIYFTRIDERKPIDRIAEIMEFINSNGLEEKYLLNIYGKVHKDYKDKFLLRIKDIKNINYQGIIAANDIRNIMMNHDLMLYPISAKEDVFPGVLLDAFSGKLPVIARNSNYISEIIKDNINGYLINTDEDSRWLAAIEKVRQMQDDEYSNFSESTYNNALQYDTKKVLMRLLELLRKGGLV